MAELDKIRIGTSGYSFLDWVGPFYPPGIQKGKMLDHYIQFFDTVEVNASYYHAPHPKVWENMLSKTDENFDFMVKMHKSVTHDRHDIVVEIDKFKRSVQPLNDAYRLKGLLLQFPYSFRWSRKNQSYVQSVAYLMNEFQLYIEFRHRSWIRDNFIELLKDMKVALCSVDGPLMQSLPRHELHDISNRIYLRLHGRNKEQWWNGGALRYDYLYNESELKDWIHKIKRSKADVREIYIFFNNCHAGQAVRNAEMMKQLVRDEIALEAEKDDE